MFLGRSAGDLLWWANEVRIWALAGIGILGIVTFVASYAQIRLQTIVTQEKDGAFERFRTKAAADIAQSQAEAAKAGEAAALANERTERLRANVSWRRLTKEQHDQIVQSLVGHSIRDEITIAYLASDPETALFADDIGTCLTHAGIPVLLQPIVTPGPTIGILLHEGDSANGKWLRAAFEAAQIPFTPGKASELRITIGSKPPPF
jgi:hypothetical protein